MALIKEYNYGTKQGNYWKIIGVYPDFTYTVTQVNMALYKDKDARAKDVSSYVLSMKYSLSGLKKDKRDIYKELKEHREFEGAIDA